ncbi:MAG TPA: hypothetical protein PKA27_04250 [Fimbriimonadaceae bacterium]|nr:hypothetical protein [Fimbriimonadaceae bacterium]
MPKIEMMKALWLATSLMLLGGFVQQDPGPKGKVALFISTDCPVALKYTRRINDLVKVYAPKGIEFHAYFPNKEESKDACATYMKERGYPFDFEQDFGAVHAKKEGVEGVPTIVIYDAKGKKVYLGSIDDNKDASLVKRKYAIEVLDKVAAGKSVEFKTTRFFGCVLMPGEAPVSLEEVNYAEHVAPILDKNCLSCHRPGETAPFSLVGYEQARKWAPMISIVTSRGVMPPWKSIKGFGDHLDGNWLTEAEIGTLANWDRKGAPRGNPDYEPQPRRYRLGWQLGQPDLVIGPDREFTLGEDGSDLYRVFVIPTSFEQTRYVRGLEVQPGNKKIVHHVIAYLDLQGRAAKLAEASKDGQPGYENFGGVGFVPDGQVGSWAPGLKPRFWPKGTGFELPPGATIVLQVHYHKTGRVETDQTQVGLFFDRERLSERLQMAWVAKKDLAIPAGHRRFEAKTVHTFEKPGRLYAVMPHMHLLGKTFRARLVQPDGTVTPLVKIDLWDFNWQLNYTFSKPIPYVAGARIEVEATYDNSDENINNPSAPPKVVTWGEKNSDEMLLLIATYADR